MADPMTPEQLHAALDARRRERGLMWWQVAVEMDVGPSTLERARYGQASAATLRKGAEWLRRPAPPWKE